MGRTQAIFSQTFSKEHTTNHEGFSAFVRPCREQYVQMLLTNTMNNTFYATQQDLVDGAREMHRNAADEDPFFMAKALVYARTEGFMRLQPIYGLAVLSEASPSLFVQAFPSIIRIVADLADFFTILESMGRGQGGRAVKRMAADFLNRSDEYAAIKYGGSGRGFSFGDLVRVVHPKPKDAKQETLFRYARGGYKSAEEIPEDLPAACAIERLANVDTVEQVQLIRKHRLAHNVVSGKVSKMTREIWEALLPDMPLFALLRHLATFERHQIVDDWRDFLEKRITDGPAIRRAKILPFRFLKAHGEIKTPWLRDALKTAVENSIGALPDMPGKTGILLDVSGSMAGEYLQTGGVLAFALFKKTNGETQFLTFNDCLHDPRPSLTDSIIGQAERLKGTDGTDTGIGIRYWTKEKEHLDNIIIITDEQQNTGTPFTEALKEYRQSVNPETVAFVIDVAPYKGRMIAPNDEKTYYAYGWSDAVLRYVACTLSGYSNIVGYIEAGWPAVGKPAAEE